MLWRVFFEFILASKQLSKTVLLENLNVNFFESFALYFSQKMILISSQMLQIIGITNLSGNYLKKMVLK